MGLLQVVDAVYDCKSEVIGPGFFRFKAEIGKNLVSYYLSSLLTTKVKNCGAFILCVLLFSRP